MPLYLLDADRPENSETARWITSRLYIGDEDTRLAQYMLLGIGGVRALEAMGIEPSIVHLNEGHAAFVSLELARREYSGNGSLSAALEIARRRTVFTTHTPVPAGNDTYPAHQVEDVLATSRARSASTPAEIISLGRTNPDEEAEPFGVTQFALRTSRAANGVSRRHGEVAREMWHAMWADKRGRRRPDHPRHQRRPHPDLARHSRCGSCSTAISARTGWTARPTRRPGRRSTTSRPRRSGTSAGRSASS